MESPSAPKKVFVSYARKDRKFALRLVRDLRAAGVTVWIDTAIQGGDSWVKKLDEGLKASKEVFLIVSPRSKASIWVEREVIAAFDRNMLVTPVVSRKCGQWSLINNLQSIDFKEWYEEGFAKLMKRPVPHRPLGRRALILLNKISRPLLAVLAILIGIAVYEWFWSPSITSFNVAGDNTAAIVAHVRNRGGRPSVLMGTTFKLNFGNLPIETQPLVLLDPKSESLIPGHSERDVLLATRGGPKDNIMAHMLTPKKKSEDSYFSIDDIGPLLPSANIAVTARVRESDDHVYTRSSGEFPAERIKNFILEVYPHVP